MIRRQYPKSKKLAEMFLDKIKDNPNVVIFSNSGVCYVKVYNVDYCLYFKCVTPEGKPHPIERQRAQLPQRASFEKIKESDVTFLFMGYDMDNDVYVCWEPAKVKPRLNKKSYVSFYSRLSIQESVVEGEVRVEKLTNGDKFVLFKSSDILLFFQNIGSYFSELSNNTPTLVSDNQCEYRRNDGAVKCADVAGELNDINNDALVKQLVDGMKGCSVIQIISSCMNEFGEHYPKMSLTAWNKILKKYMSD